MPYNGPVKILSKDGAVLADALLDMSEYAAGGWGGTVAVPVEKTFALMGGNRVIEFPNGTRAEIVVPGFDQRNNTQQQRAPFRGSGPPPLVD